jgi:hypothetical protein
MATVLITGGTGLIGKNLTAQLTAKGYKVIILSRNPKKYEQNSQIKYALWDVEKQQIDASAIAEADHIIHLAGAGVMEKRWTEKYKKEIIDSRIKSSQLLIKGLTATDNNVKTVVSASAIGWYGKDKKPIKPFEEKDVADDSFLGETCKLWEESIEPVTQLNKRLVKLRLGIVLSNDGGALVEFKKPLQFGIAAILGTGKQMISWIHIDDICRMFIYAIENNISGSFNAAAPQPVTNKTLTLKLADLMRKKFYIPVYVPQFILKFVLGQRSIEILKSTTVSDEKIRSAGFTFLYPSIDAALKDLITK